MRDCDVLSLSNAYPGTFDQGLFDKVAAFLEKVVLFADRPLATCERQAPVMMMLRPPSTLPPAPTMSEREALSEVDRFLASIDGGGQAKKQTALFSLDNHANDAAVSVRPTPNFDAWATSKRSPAPSARRCSASPLSPSLWSPASAGAAMRCTSPSPPATRPPTEPATASRPGGRSRARLERVAQDVVRHTVRLGIGESQRSTDRGARVRRPRHHLRRGNLATPASSVGTRPTEAAAALGAARDATPDAGRAAARDATSGRRASVRLQSAWRGLAQRARRFQVLAVAQQRGLAAAAALCIQRSERARGPRQRLAASRVAAVRLQAFTRVCAARARRALLHGRAAAAVVLRAVRAWLSARRQRRAEQAEVERLGSELAAERRNLATSAISVGTRSTEPAAARDATPDVPVAPGSRSTPDAGPPAALEPGLFALLIPRLLGLLNGAYGPRACYYYMRGARRRSWAQWDWDLLLFARSAQACLGPILMQLERTEKLRRSVFGLHTLWSYL